MEQSDNNRNSSKEIEAEAHNERRRIIRNLLILLMTQMSNDDARIFTRNCAYYCHGRWSLGFISYYNGATWCNSVVVVSRFDSVIDRLPCHSLKY